MGLNLAKKTSWQPPIFFAASSGSLRLVEYLTEKGADPLTKSRGRSLFLAMVAGGKMDSELFRFFEKKGLNLKYDLDRYGRNALLIAAQKMKKPTDLQLFEKYGFDLNSTDSYGNGIFFYASRSGNVKLLKYLVAQGYYYKENYNSGDNAFTFVTQRSRGVKPVTLEVLNYLKSLGLNPAKINKEGYNALLNMVFSVDDPKIWEFFIKHGADPNLEGSRGQVLIPACFRRSVAVLKVVLSKTKDINKTNKDGATALTIAAAYNTPEVVKFLLEQNADVKIIDKKGHDLGGYMVTKYRRNIQQLKQKMALLIKKGYNPKYIQPDGSTLLHLAAKKDKPELISYLLTLGIGINQKDNNGYTALHKAAMTTKNLKTLKLLIKKGADKSIKTEFGESVYDLAKENELLSGKGKKFNVTFLK